MTARDHVERYAAAATAAVRMPATVDELSPRDRAVVEAAARYNAVNGLDGPATAADVLAEWHSSSNAAQAEAATIAAAARRR